MAGWRRPPGPLNVWNIVEGYEKLADGSKKVVKFSIQDIPNDENRRIELLNLLTDIFLRQEPLCSSNNFHNNPIAVECFKTIWKYQLDQGVVVGCYLLDTGGKIEKLVGANTIHISTNDTDNDLKNIAEIYGEKCPTLRRSFAFVNDLMKKADVRKKYNVDKYISSWSLVVIPEFRGQKLGIYLLEARSAVAKKYGLTATSSYFSANSSQIQAKRAGFEEVYCVDYADVLDETGNPLFPNIQSTCAKIMMKRLP